MDAVSSSLPISKESLIEKIILDFYKNATTDILIGYQFRKIQQLKGEEHHPLRPPIEAFFHHIPRINQFWKQQLLQGPHKEDLTPPFNLINSHAYLNLKKGELKRFQKLFKQSIEHFEKIYKDQLIKNAEVKDEDFFILWRKKLDHLVHIFLK